MNNAGARITQAPPDTQSDCLPTGGVENPSRWARLLMPSIADVIFLVLFWFLSFGAWGPRLLDDADTGWHIRNGEHILATQAVPQTDYFSYTMSGQRWYAWEWLYDAAVGFVHRLGGLNGVVVLSALLIAVTLALLFKMTLRRSGNPPIAAGLSLATALAASIHFLARPHLISWLFVLLFFGVLDRFETDRNWKHLIWLPVFMIPWVNLHGGFLLGLALPLIFATAKLWRAVMGLTQASRRRNARDCKRLLLATSITFIVTLANPYGWHLYGHLRQYLGSRFMMSNINEFQSPDFHLLQPKVFLGMLLLAIVALASARRRTAINVLLICFSAFAGCYAARNIPIACMLLSLTTAPLLASVIEDASESDHLPSRTVGWAKSWRDFGTRMSALEQQLRGHIWPAAAVVATCLIVLNGGRAFSSHVLDNGFDGKRMPVAAANYLQTRHIERYVFTQDSQGGYLIYSLYPGFRVFVDDRHDFYGEQFLKDYLEVVRVRPDWRRVLDKYGVKYVLMPPDAALSTVLRSSPEWKIVYSDPAWLIFAR